jgi:hypothetical protein
MLCKFLCNQNKASDLTVFKSFVSTDRAVTFVSVDLTKHVTSGPGFVTIFLFHRVATLLVCVQTPMNSIFVVSSSVDFQFH